MSFFLANFAPMSFFSRYRKWIVGIVLFYFGLAAALYFFQEKLLFHPKPLESGEAYHFDQPSEEITINYNETEKISLVRFMVPDTAKKGTVIFFHGNRGNIARYAKYAPLFTELGYEVWMMDYPGFGKSTGEISQEILYRDALLFYDRVAAGTNSDSIIVYGKSIGTGMASYVATRRNCRELILETPYYSITRLASHFLPIYPVGWLLRYHMSNAENLEKVTVPVLLLHGTADGIIPYEHSLELEQESQQRAIHVKLVGVEGGSHNDLLSFKTFRSAIDRALKN